MMDNAMRFGAVTRRKALTAFAASGVTATLGGTPAQAGPAASLIPGVGNCVLTPQAIEGPYYFDPKLVRADIAEGRPGVPLALALQIVSAADCRPLPNARVDVWHADALGYYSGYRGQSDAGNVSTTGQNFLRGTQFSDASGQVNFGTIYPGWYQGRTVHIHCKVFLDEKTVLTTQLYFPDALSEYIYRNVRPYDTRGRERDTVNSTDGVLKQSDSDHTSFLHIKEQPARYLASLIISVDRDARPIVATGPGLPPDGFPPGGPPPDGMPPPGGPRVVRPSGPLVPGVAK